MVKNVGFELLWRVPWRVYNPAMLIVQGIVWLEGHPTCKDMLSVCSSYVEEDSRSQTFSLTFTLYII